MGHTISGTSTVGVTLGNVGYNPITVTDTAHLSLAAYSYAALYGEGGTGKSWTISNAGMIDGGTHGNGIQLGSGDTYVGAGVVTNQSGGTINGVYGIRMYNTAASSIVNLAGGTIESSTNRAIYFNSASTLTNSGVISAPTANDQQTGVLMGNGGTIINNAGGIISGDNGVILLGSSTVINAGTIAAGSGFAVEFAGGASRLIVAPAAVFDGSVSGGGGVLELASAASAGNLTVTNFQGFTEINFDPGAQWTVVGNAATNLAGEIEGFTGANTIDLVGFDPTALTWTYGDGELTVTNASNAHETLHFSGSVFAATDFLVHSDGGAGTDVVACFCAGTRITTPSGEIAVECLRIGDPVTTRSGIAKPVKWIGRRRYSAAQLTAATQLCPVLIRKDALAAGMPRRDLLVSPMHSMFIDEVLIPAAALVNGVSVLRRDARAPVEYTHIELAEHDVIFAEGAATETFVDDNSRAMFDNASEYFLLHGTDAAARGFCAPRVEEGFLLEAVRRRLAGRAGLPTVAGAPGKLLGHVEHFENGVLDGWVMDDANRTVPVELEVLVDGDSVIRLVANGYRSDLDRAGLAGGRCAFSVVLPTSVRHIGQVRAKRPSDGMNLPIACVAEAGSLRLHASA